MQSNNQWKQQFLIIQYNEFAIVFGVGNKFDGSQKKKK